MALQLSVQGITGIAAGGFVILVTLGVSLVIVITRAKERRLRARTNAVGSRRHSRHSGGLMSITDEDVMRMPGTRAALRRSLQLQATRSPYTPLSSRDTLEARRASRSHSQTRTSVRVDHEPVQAWPLPRRLQRSHASPIGKSQSTPRSPFTERNKKNIIKPSKTNERTESAGPPKQNGVLPAADLRNVQDKTTGAQVSPRSALTPKPLFHGQQHSISNGMMTKYAAPSKTAVANAMDSEDPAPRPLDRPPLPRSTSMYDQPGLAPTDFLPPLPFQVPATGPPTMKSPADSSARRFSGGTILSDNTSILDDSTPKAVSRAATDRTSIGILSALNLESATNAVDQQNFDRAPWVAPDRDGRISPLSAVDPSTVRPPLASQKSFRASIHDSLPRSKSSGLSINMSLCGPSTSASSTDLSKDTFSTAQSRLPAQNNPAKENPRRRSSPSSRRGRSDTFHIYEDTKGSQSSTAGPQSLPGNEGSAASSPSKTRPSSINDSPQQSELMASMDQRKSPMLKTRGNLQERENTMTFSGRATEPTVIEDRNPNTEANPTPGTIINKSRNQGEKFRPPSLPKFSPHILATARTHSRTQNLIKTGNPISSPLSLCSGSDEDCNSDLEAYTPTRKPISRRRHSNRLKSIFDVSDTTSWPLPDTPDPLKLKMLEETAEIAQKEEGIKQRSVFSIHFPDFPNPPKNQPRRQNLPNWRGPKTTIRGPRGPPAGFQFTATRRSPSRGVSKARGNSPSKALSPSKIPRKNVLALENAAALRRQNSEANSEAFTRGSKEHKRYLSIGSRESDIFEDPDQPIESVEGKGNVQSGGEAKAKDIGHEVVKGPRAMPLSSRIPKNPKSTLQGRGIARWNTDPEVGMYDAEGFLRV